MKKVAKVIMPADMSKDAVMSNMLAGLAALGSLATVAYSAAYLKDRDERMKWQDKIEKQLRDETGKRMKAHVPEVALPSSPIVVMPEEEKIGTLLAELSEKRALIINAIKEEKHGFN